MLSIFPLFFLYLPLGQDHQIALYTYNVLLFLTDLSHSIPSLLDLIKDFRMFSGFKINNAKSLMMLSEHSENVDITELACPYCIYHTVCQRGAPLDLAA